MVSFVLPSDEAIQNVVGLLTDLTPGELSRVMTEVLKEKPRTYFLIEYLKEAADRRLNVKIGHGRNLNH